MEFRRIEESIFKALMILSLVFVVGSLLFVVGVILWRGLPVLSFDMITKTGEGGYLLGKGGGILNAIVGSLYLAAGGTILAFFLSIAIAFYLQKEYSGGTRLSGMTRLSLDILWGTPSIVYGAFGYIDIDVFSYQGIPAWRYNRSCTSGNPHNDKGNGRGSKDGARDLKETAYSLGATRFETTLKVVGKQALPGLLTGVLMAFGRGIGDAASILFTAGYTDRIPRSLCSMPLHLSQ